MRSIVKKLGIILNYLLILLLVIQLALTPPAYKYEYSIYQAYPVWFWMSIAFIFVNSFLIVLGSISSDARGIISFEILATLLSAFLALFVLLSLPVFRGYAFYGEGDIYAHFGRIKDIIMTGHISYENPYPLTHILIYSLSLAQGLPVFDIVYYFNQMMVSIYVLGLFVINAQRGLKYGVLTAIFAIFPVFQYWLTINYIFPSNYAFFLLPLVLFTSLKLLNRMHVSWTVVEVVLIISLSFFHPESALFIVPILALLMFSKVMSSKKLVFVDFLRIFLLLIVLFVSLSNTYGLKKIAQQLYLGLLFFLAREGGTNVYMPPLFAILSSTFGWSFLNLLIQLYGLPILYISTSAYLIVRLFIKDRHDKYQMVFSGLFIVSIFLAIVFLSLGTAIGFQVYRQIKYAILVSTILLGMNFTKLENHKKIVFGTLLLFLIPIAVMNTFYTPRVYRYNMEADYATISEMSFFFKVRNEELSILEIGTRGYQYWFSFYIFGARYATNNKPIAWAHSLDILPPKNFGYAKKDTLGSYYSSKKYLLIYPPYKDLSYLKVDTFPISSYPPDANIWRYNPEDFKRLCIDKTVNTIYSSSGSYGVYLVYPTSLL